LWLVTAINLAVPTVAISLLAVKLGINPASLFESPGETTSTIQVFYQMTSPLAQTTGVSPDGFAPSTDHNEVYCMLSLVWVAGFLFFASVWGRNRLRLSRAFKLGKEVTSGREVEILRRVASWLQVKREPGLVLSPGTIEPGVRGMWRPVVILPATISDHLSEAELESVIMHEIVHVLRRDNLVSNAQMLVCCAFWFHPFSWLIDRKLLAERERACDEKVIELGGRSQVYATSLLKVLRFCMGLKMAGVSSAAGSNLQRRIEQIMANSEKRSLSVAQRFLVCSVAAAVICLSFIGGFLTANNVAAQDSLKKRRPIRGGVAGGVQGGVAGGVEGGVPGGVSGGVPGGVSRGVEGGVPGGVPGGVQGGVPGDEWLQDGSVLERLRQSPDIVLRFDISNNAPLMISEASIRAIKQKGSDEDYIVVPRVKLTNITKRRVSGFLLEYIDAGGKSDFHMEHEGPIIEPDDSYVTGPNNYTLISLSGSPESWVMKVAGVLFEDGKRWGMLPPPPPPPPGVGPRGEGPTEDGPPGDGIIRRPRLLNRVYPRYTEEARRNKVSGQVKMEILIGEDGVVREAKIIEGLPDGLNDKAIRAAHKMRFSPATRNGVPIEVWVGISMVFSLR
jgi:TonB family protein